MQICAEMWFPLGYRLTYSFLALWWAANIKEVRIIISFTVFVRNLKGLFIYLFLAFSLRNTWTDKKFAVERPAILPIFSISPLNWNEKNPGYALMSTSRYFWGFYKKINSKTFFSLYLAQNRCHLIITCLRIKST